MDPQASSSVLWSWLVARETKNGGSCRHTPGRTVDLPCRVGQILSGSCVIMLSEKGASTVHLGAISSSVVKCACTRFS